MFSPSHSIYLVLNGTCHLTPLLTTPLRGKSCNHDCCIQITVVFPCFFLSTNCLEIQNVKYVSNNDGTDPTTDLPTEAMQKHNPYPFGIDPVCLCGSGFVVYFYVPL